MKKNTNYNFVFVFYDVDQKRCHKLFKICKKYLIHYQRSIFKGNISPANIIKIKKEIQKVTKENDFVCIIKMQGSFVFEEEIIAGEKSSDLFV